MSRKVRPLSDAGQGAPTTNPRPIPDSPTPRRTGASRSARPPQRDSHPSTRHRRSRESGNPGPGRGEGRLRPPLPDTPSNASPRFRSPPLPPPGHPDRHCIPDSPTATARPHRDSVRPAACRRAPTHQQPPPTRTPPSSFSRKREPRAGARRGGVPVSRRSRSPLTASFMRRQEPRGAGEGSLPPAPP